MKYNKGNFFQTNKENFLTITQSELTPSHKYLYCVLLYLEHQLTDGKTGSDSFYRSLDDLRRDSKLSRQTIFTGLKELQKIGLIKKWLKPVIRNGSKKDKKEKITYIRIL